MMDRDGADACPSQDGPLKDVQQIKLGQHTRDFSWLGCPWTCKRKRRHYPSFSRNGIKISVHDFVYVLAEEGKRLVAYLEDMYEDSRSNRMVVVRWFHKIDEVDIVLPRKFNDREIFFSLCLQDLSIECIDGLATVLSPHHFQKFQNEAKHTRLEPFVCDRQFDNDDIKSFDITQVKGYWKQEILRYMYALSSSKSHGQPQQSEDDANAAMRPRKRHRRSKDDDLQNIDKRQQPLAHVSSCQDVRGSGNNMVDFKSNGVIFSPRGGCASKTFLGKELKNNNSSGRLTVGSEVEVLSQDSGIRGCWFRASIIKKRRDKVKVQYHDLQDADVESNKLVEWLSSTRVAAPDQLGLRINGRLVVRPQPGMGSKISLDYNIGTVVDVWWHDGWWEGIVVRKEPEEKLRVHLQGEKQELVFGPGELRHSQEWFGNRWMQMQERADIATSILTRTGNKGLTDKASNGKLTTSTQVAICDTKQQPDEDRIQSIEPRPNSNTGKAKESCTVPDLSKDDSLFKLRWTVSRKRSQPSGSNSLPKHLEDPSKSFPPSLASSSPCERFVIPASMKVDHDNCKYLGDSLFTSSVVPPLSSLVMSR
ncbi:uncharacterized protein LOC111007667 isoform X2 [Momordica charantia]|nr:uncharacterized protein LOC111007667 isoform X2 [Momordica charantia]